MNGPNSLPYVRIIPPVAPAYTERANFGTHSYTPEWDCHPHMCIIPADGPCEHGVRWEFTSPEKDARDGIVKRWFEG